jgi:hypothetical protein
MSVNNASQRNTVPPSAHPQFVDPLTVTQGINSETLDIPKAYVIIDRKDKSLLKGLGKKNDENLKKITKIRDEGFVGKLLDFRTGIIDVADAVFIQKVLGRPIFNLEEKNVDRFCVTRAQMDGMQSIRSLPSYGVKTIQILHTQLRVFFYQNQRQVTSDFAKKLNDIYKEKFGKILFDFATILSDAERKAVKEIQEWEAENPSPSEDPRNSNVEKIIQSERTTTMTTLPSSLNLSQCLVVDGFGQNDALQHTSQDPITIPQKRQFEMMVSGSAPPEGSIEPRQKIQRTEGMDTVSFSGSVQHDIHPVHLNRPHAYEIPPRLNPTSLSTSIPPPIFLIPGTPWGVKNPAPTTLEIENEKTEDSIPEFGLETDTFSEGKSPKNLDIFDTPDTALSSTTYFDVPFSLDPDDYQPYDHF